MAGRILHPEFRDRNRENRYPFGDNASLKTADGQFEIDDDTFIDASLHVIGAVDRLFISNINVTSREVTLSFSDVTRSVKATASFDPLSPAEHVRVVDLVGRPAGLLLSDALRLSRFSSWSEGDHPFDLGATEFAASVVIPTPQEGVRGLQVPAGGTCNGDVWLVGDNGVVLREVDGKIRIDAVGDPLFRRRLCQPAALFSNKTFLQTINQCPPDEFGNYALPVSGLATEDTVLRVYPTDEGLVVEAVGRSNRE